MRQLYGMARRLRWGAFAFDLADVFDVALAAAASWRFALDDESRQEREDGALHGGGAIDKLCDQRRAPATRLPKTSVRVRTRPAPAPAQSPEAAALVSLGVAV